TFVFDGSSRPCLQVSQHIGECVLRWNTSASGKSRALPKTRGDAMLAGTPGPFLHGDTMPDTHLPVIARNRPTSPVRRHGRLPIAVAVLLSWCAAGNGLA